MAEHIFLFAGPMGAGKTTAICSVSEIEVVSTEARNNDRSITDKETTTVALDYGEILISDEERIRLYGLPGQKRFDFMWTILLERAMGLVLLVDNAARDPFADMLAFLDDFAPLVDRGAVVVAVSRTDLAPDPTIAVLSNALAEARPGMLIPIMPMDPRNSAEVRLVLMTLVASLEMRSLLETSREDA